MAATGVSSIFDPTSTATGSTSSSASDPYADWQNQFSNYFGAYNQADSAVVNVPGYGNLQRLYNQAPTQDQFMTSGQFGGGEGGSQTYSPDTTAYQNALTAYNATPEADRYTYTNANTISPTATSDHIQTYSYDPTQASGVKINGTDNDWSPNFLMDKLFPGLVTTAIGAAAGAGAYGALGAAGGDIAGAGTAAAGAGGDVAAGEYGLEGLVNSGGISGLGDAADTAGSILGNTGSIDVGGATQPDFGLANFSAGGDAADGAASGTGGLDVAASTDGVMGTSSYLDQLQTLAKQYGFGNGPLGSIQNIVNGTGQVGDYASTASNLNTVDGFFGNSSGGNNVSGDSTSQLDTSGGFSDARDTPIDYNGGLSGASNTPTIGGYLSNLYNDPLGTLSSLNSGLKSSTGISGVQAIAGLLDGYNKLSQNNNNISTRNTLSNLFSPSSAYAQQLQQTLSRRDAASGRQSQYGPRQVELEADLAKLQAGVLNSSNYSSLNNSTALGGVFNSLYASYNQNQGADQGAAALTNLLTKYFGGGST